MLRNLLVGLPVTLLCLFLQGIFVAKGQDLGTMVGKVQGNTLVGKTGSF